jgi:hypothetical protein
LSSIFDILVLVRAGEGEKWYAGDLSSIIHISRMIQTWEGSQRKEMKEVLQ